MYLKSHAVLREKVGCRRGKLCDEQGLLFLFQDDRLMHQEVGTWTEWTPLGFECLNPFSSLDILMCQSLTHSFEKLNYTQTFFHVKLILSLYFVYVCL